MSTLCATSSESVSHHVSGIAARTSGSGPTIGVDDRSDVAVGHRLDGRIQHRVYQLVVWTRTDRPTDNQTIEAVDDGRVQADAILPASGLVEVVRGVPWIEQIVHAKSAIEFRGFDFCFPELVMDIRINFREFAPLTE